MLPPVMVSEREVRREKERLEEAVSLMFTAFGHVAGCSKSCTVSHAGVEVVIRLLNLLLVCRRRDNEGFASKMETSSRGKGPPTPTSPCSAQRRDRSTWGGA